MVFRNTNRGRTYIRKTKRKSRDRRLSGKIDTLAEKIARRQAKLEIEKNKEPKYLVYVQRGTLVGPQYNTAPLGEYTEPYVHNYPVLDNTPLYGMDVMSYPKIRLMPQFVNVVGRQTINAGNDKFCYIDGNEWGSSGRKGQSVLVKGFKINIEIEPNKDNTTDREVQIDLVFYESYPDDTEGKQINFNQFIMPSIDQKDLCSTRMIRNILGSTGAGGTNPRENVIPDIGATIKKLHLKKTWVLKPKQSIKETSGTYEFIQTNIKQEFYIPIDKKITYSRGPQQEASVEESTRKGTGLLIENATGQEKVDSYENRKYYCACKSNIASDQENLLPKLKLIVTTYYTDIN